MQLPAKMLSRHKLHYQFHHASSCSQSEMIRLFDDSGQDKAVCQPKLVPGMLSGNAC